MLEELCSLDHEPYTVHKCFHVSPRMCAVAYMSQYYCFPAVTGMQNMLLRRLWEIQQDQERKHAAAAAAAENDMEVDGAADQPMHKSGVVQKDLVDWYFEKQLQRCAVKGSLKEPQRHGVHHVWLLAELAMSTLPVFANSCVRVA